jgi:multiple sugar transport system ATP-binding protein
MCGELRRLHDRISATTVYVTHDQIEAMMMADRIAVMNHGIVDQIGTPREVYETPASLHVAGFIGSPPMNFLGFRGALAPGATSLELEGQPIAIPPLAEGVSERDLILGVRPENVALVSEGGLRGTVFGTEYMGTFQIVTVSTRWGPLKARVSSSLPVGVGSAVGLALTAEHIVLFDPATGRALPRRADAAERATVLPGVAPGSPSSTAYV